MKILEMTATFGKLERTRLTLEDGLNVIHAPNEGGKSTWCAFLRAMLYGISTRERDKKGVLAEKNRWQPWSGAPMEGELRLVWQDRDITLRRFSRGNVPFGGFSAVYTGTQEPVPGLTGENCGTTLLGVGREVWERSAFIGHTPTLAIDGAPELERRIAALVTSGEEDVSFSQAEQLLREWLRRRRHNRSGLIPKLEEELTQAQDTLSRVLSAEQRMAQGEQDRAALEEELALLCAEQHIHQRLAQRRRNQRYAQACSEREQVERELAELEQLQAGFGTLPHRELLLDTRRQLTRLALQAEQLEQAWTQIAHPRQQEHTPQHVSVPACFAGLDGAQALVQAHNHRTQAQQIQEQVDLHMQRRWLCLLPGLLTGGALALAGALLSAAQPWLLVAGVLTAALLSGGLLAANHTQMRHKRDALSQLLRPYGTSHPEDLISMAEAYRQQEQEYLRQQEEKLRRQAEQLRQQEDCTARRQALEAEQASVLSFVRSFAPDTHSLFACETAISRALTLQENLEQCRIRLDMARSHCRTLEEQGAQLTDTLELLQEPLRPPEQTAQALELAREHLTLTRQQIASAQGELLSLGNRAQLEARADELKRQLERRRQEYQALELALDCLRQANTQLRERFAPELNRRSGELLSRLTGGRYRQITLSREMDASVRSAEDVLPRGTLTLSRGTADQVYLAVRLAVCQLCLPEHDPSPLVLDDALLTFDEERLALALDCLAGLGRQVVLFSCQERESQMGKGHVRPLQS